MLADDQGPSGSAGRAAGSVPELTEKVGDASPSEDECLELLRAFADIADPADRRCLLVQARDVAARGKPRSGE